MLPAPLIETRHIMPGRLRCRLPRLRYDENFALRLQAILEGTPGVTGVRMNMAAGSLIIHVTPEQWPPATVVDLIQESARQALQPAIVPQLQLRFDVFLAKHLSSYEFLQVQAIKNAWRQEPRGLMVWLARVLRQITAVGDRLLPQAIFQRIADLHEQLVGKWRHQWQALQAEVGQMDCQEMRRAPLEVCDRLAQRVRQSGLRWGTGEGAFLGALGPVGLLGSIPLTVVQALQLIQQLGLCYGYPPRERARKTLRLCGLGRSYGPHPGGLSGGAAESAAIAPGYCCQHDQGLPY